MKKVFLIALLAVFSITGLMAQEDWWYVVNRDGASRPRNNWNQVTLSQNMTNYVYVYFRGEMNPVGADFDKMRINFTLSTPVEVIWQCVYYADMSGGVLGCAESTGVRDSGPLETDFVKFNQAWSGKDTGLNKEKMTGFCLEIPVPRGTGNVTLNISSIELIGLKK